MNLEYRSLLDESLAPDSRVWVYQSSRLFGLGEALQIEDILDEFIKEWNTHGTPVKGAAYLFFGQFVILVADENVTPVSGCSTDSSVRMIKKIEQSFPGVNMFDRTSLAFVIKDKLQLLPMAQIPYALENGFINGDTLYFNNLVATKKELEENWIVPIKNSWLAAKYSLV